MVEIKIKEASKQEFVAFGGGGKLLLGERSQEDLRLLALMALQSKNKNLLRHFEGELPTIAELQAEAVKSETKTVAQPPVKEDQKK